MICQCCGIEAPTKKVSFHQNIGALIVRFGSATEGHLCKRCIHKRYWKHTLTTLFLGWWGAISLIITPVYLIANTVSYLLALPLPAPGAHASVPELDEHTLDTLQPFTNSIFERLDSQEPFDQVAEDVAVSAGVTPGQVALYTQLVAEAAEQQASA